MFDDHANLPAGFIVCGSVSRRARQLCFARRSARDPVVDPARSQRVRRPLPICNPLLILPSAKASPLHWINGIWDERSDTGYDIHMTWHPLRWTVILLSLFKKEPVVRISSVGWWAKRVYWSVILQLQVMDATKCIVLVQILTFLFEDVPTD